MSRRASLYIGEDLNEFLDDIRNMSSPRATKTETVKKALRIYGKLMEAERNGETFFFKRF